MPSHVIGNDLELWKPFENNVSKACLLTLLETNWNCRNPLKTMSLKHAFSRYWKRFGTVETL